jgi:hypothetical protein
MPTNVTEYVNTFVQNNPNANAEVKAGAASSAALFSAAQTGNFNVSTVINSLPPGAQANVRAAQANIAANTRSNATSKSSTTNSNLGIDDAKKATFTQGVNRAILEQPDIPTGAPTKQVKPSIPILTSVDVRALMVQIAYMETNWDSTYNEPPRIGRYAVHEKTLKSYGYKNSNTGAYLGKDGIKSEIDFTFDNVVQDRIMERFILEQYPALIKTGGIKDNDTKETVAGMIAVAYQFQDANVTIGAITDIIGSVTGGLITSVVTGAASLGTSLVSSLSGTSLGVAKSTSVGASTQTLNSTASDQSTNANIQAVQSNIAKAQSLISAFTGTDSGAAAVFTTLLTVGAAVAAANKSKSNVGSNTTSSTTSTVPTNKQAGLPPTLTGGADQAKVTAAKVDATALKQQSAGLAISLPANKATEWRKKGAAKDSRGRPGSLFFNAGRYAISTLNADVTVATAPTTVATI